MSIASLSNIVLPTIVEDEDLDEDSDEDIGKLEERQSSEITMIVKNDGNISPQDGIIDEFETQTVEKNEGEGEQLISTANAIPTVENQPASDATSTNESYVETSADYITPMDEKHNSSAQEQIYVKNDDDMGININTSENITKEQQDVEHNTREVSEENENTLTDDDISLSSIPDEEKEVIATTAVAISSAPEEEKNESISDKVETQEVRESTSDKDHEEYLAKAVPKATIEKEPDPDLLVAIPNTLNNDNANDPINIETIVTGNDAASNADLRIADSDSSVDTNFDDCEGSSITSSSSTESLDDFFNNPSNSSEFMDDDYYYDTLQMILIASNVASSHACKLYQSPSHRYIGLYKDAPYSSYIAKQFQKRNFVVDRIDDNQAKEKYFDVATFILHDYDDEDRWINDIKYLQQSIVNGGHFILFLILSSTNNINNTIGIEKYGFSFKTWCNDPTILYENDELLVLSLQKRPCLVNTSSCSLKYSLSKQSKHHYNSLRHEYDILSQVTITSSAHEYRNPKLHTELSQHSISKAIYALQKFGFCVIKNIIPIAKIRLYNEAVSEDIDEIRHVIQHKCNFDITSDKYSFENGELVPLDYNEMRITDDHRINLRSGPNVTQVIKDVFHWTTSDTRAESIDKIISKTMNPPLERLDESNVFDNENLPENIHQWDVRNSYIKDIACKSLFNDTKNDKDGPRINFTGFLISFPKCKDEEINTNANVTRHQLFEYYATEKNKKVQDLPPHSIIAHIPTNTSLLMKSNGSNCIGGSAFVAGSHLSRKHHAYLENKKLLHANIIRPSITPGDIILFDSRIMNFGLANTSTLDDDKYWNTTLYLNWTKSWFVDPEMESGWNSNQNSLFCD